MAVFSTFYLGLMLGQDLIKRIILTTTGFDAVNRAVRSQLVDQLKILLHGCKNWGEKEII